MKNGRKFLSKLLIGPIEVVCWACTNDNINFEDKKDEEACFHNEIEEQFVEAAERKDILEIQRLLGDDNIRESTMVDVFLKAIFEKNTEVIDILKFKINRKIINEIFSRL